MTDHDTATRTTVVSNNKTQNENRLQHLSVALNRIEHMCISLMDSHIATPPVEKDVRGVYRREKRTKSIALWHEIVPVRS